MKSSKQQPGRRLEVDRTAVDVMVPGEDGRTLRCFMEVTTDRETKAIVSAKLQFEPDGLSPP